MSDVTLRNERFPQGTSVSVYPFGARQLDRSPAAQPVKTATVGADQKVTFTALPDDTHFVAYAKVGSEHRYVEFRS